MRSTRTVGLQRSRLALDDFGSGYSGLNLLADLPVDHLKLDIDLVRNLQQRPTALTIVESVVALAAALGQDVVAEGIETVEEYLAVRGCGIRLMQGYLSPSQDLSVFRR